jgi:hypothetical protein
MVAGIWTHPQAQVGAVHAGMVVTPPPVHAVDERAIQQPAAVIQVKEQQVAPPQLPALKEFAAIDAAGAGLPTAPG